MTRRQMVELPAVILPTGRRIYASDLPRLSKRARQVIEGIVFIALLIVVIFGAALVDPVPLP